MVQALGSKKAQAHWATNLELVIQAYQEWTIEEQKTDSVDEFNGEVELVSGFVGDSESELGAEVNVDAGNVPQLAGGSAKAGAKAGREKRRAHDNKITARVTFKARSAVLKDLS